MTEASPVTHTMTDRPGIHKPGSIGPAIPNTEVKVVDVATGAELGPNEHGEILIRGPQIMHRDWRPGFTIDLQEKDLRLVMNAADELGVPLPGTALIFQLYRTLQAQGLGSEGNHALVKALERLAGFEIQPPSL